MQDVAYRRANAGMALAVGGSRNPQRIRGATARRAFNNFRVDNLVDQSEVGFVPEYPWQGKVDKECLWSAFCNMNLSE